MDNHMLEGFPRSCPTEARRVRAQVIYLTSSKLSLRHSWRRGYVGRSTGQRSVARTRPARPGGEALVIPTLGELVRDSELRGDAGWRGYPIL